MITTAAWVPRGFAAPFPTKYDFDEAEFERIAGLAKLQLDDANEDFREAQQHNGGAEGGVDPENGSRSPNKGSKSRQPQE